MSSIYKILSFLYISLTYKNIQAILFLYIALFFASCEDVIQLNVENTKPTIVIESAITDLNENFRVSISKSQNFYDTSGYITINDAQVILKDNHNLIDTLDFTGNGIYSGGNIKGISGNTYELEVMHDGVKYDATNTLPLRINIDSLSYEWVEYPQTKGYMIYIHFTDQPNVENYYRIIVRVTNNAVKNDKVGLEYLLYDDKLFDGKKTKLPVLRGSKLLKANDLVTVELYTLSKETYNYYKTLSNIIAIKKSALGVGQTMIEGASAPANPLTNFNNDALGYFGAYCISNKTVQIISQN